MFGLIFGSGRGWTEPLFIVLDVLLMAYLFYRVLLLIKGTRTLKMLIGLMIILLLYWLSSDQVLSLRTTNWLLSYFLTSALIILVILFQEDIRRALSEVGRNPWLSGPGSAADAFYEEIVQASAHLAERRFGGIFVIAQTADLDSYSENGIKLDAEVNQNLLYTIFIPKAENPLHDGAAIIQNGRVASAGCFLPLSTNPELSQNLGTRHRAAIGITEEADAIVIVISEERGTIGIAIDGELERDLNPNELRARLQSLFRMRPSKRSFFDTIRRNSEEVDSPPQDVNEVEEDEN